MAEDRKTYQYGGITIVDFDQEEPVFSAPVITAENIYEQVRKVFELHPDVDMSVFLPCNDPAIQSLTPNEIVDKLESFLSSHANAHKVEYVEPIVEHLSESSISKEITRQYNIRAKICNSLLDMPTQAERAAAISMIDDLTNQIKRLIGERALIERADKLHVSIKQNVNPPTDLELFQEKKNKISRRSQINKQLANPLISAERRAILLDQLKVVNDRIDELA